MADRFGLDPSRYVIADGSGVSLYNYASAELLVKALLYARQRTNIYGHLYPSLPVAGEDGTLRSRIGALRRSITSTPRPARSRE